MPSLSFGDGMPPFVPRDATGTLSARSVTVSHVFLLTREQTPSPATTPCLTHSHAHRGLPGSQACNLEHFYPLACSLLREAVYGSKMCEKVLRERTKAIFQILFSL